MLPDDGTREMPFWGRAVKVLFLDTTFKVASALLGEIWGRPWTKRAGLVFKSTWRSSRFGSWNPHGG